ncbi:polar amino acid ABC transporter, inner membrane subunit [Arcobacter nitrofigilis DSM 7299]|uniref:Polar amino acid ABC transporter, inner membrane subunit n=1 Tax=Arcobacter nitrofigilis (strain ATCC 33309 / DSM 7299 / CCUG 15893 / LMG 7604 / NCTC 12251 / CI) TaxID=572480 RepID=D5V3E5_ARCNC|nr:amino acid ABC transporter permease [Arcobacter nitrofigilis]ADG92727.1 polar amino acid ABC transporter, inner membrane subunit [Arcobacter nitrofigilis DSM 7299]
MDYQFDFAGVFPYYKVIIKGIQLTIEITIFTTILGLLLGILGAAIKIGEKKILKGFVSTFVEVIRNTPFIVQLFFIFFGLPAIGFKLTAMEAGIIAMVVNLGAYSTEIIRAGVEATGKGQWEAGKTMGLKWSQIFIHIILPQAFHKISPALVSQCVIVMLGSSVLSQISVEELTFSANFIQSRTFLSFESYFIVTAIYLVFAIILRFILTLISEKLFKTNAVKEGS